jgi:hypothetical protein
MGIRFMSKPRELLTEAEYKTLFRLAGWADYQGYGALALALVESCERARTELIKQMRRRTHND